jgi:hypothetical protein
MVVSTFNRKDAIKRHRLIVSGAFIVGAVVPCHIKLAAV